MLKLVVLSCVLAAASASVVGVAPLAYSAPYAYGAPIAYGAPLAYSASLLAPSNYRGPLSLAPGQPANILGVDGRPLDTLDVNLDRSAHYTAKALSGAVHVLKKRSVAPLVASHVTLAHTPVITPASPILGRVAPITPYASYVAPYASYATPYAARYAVPYTTYW